MQDTPLNITNLSCKVLSIVYYIDLTRMRQSNMAEVLEAELVQGIHLPMFLQVFSSPRFNQRSFLAIAYSQMKEVFGVHLKYRLRRLESIFSHCTHRYRYQFIMIISALTRPILNGCLMNLESIRSAS